MEQKFAKIDEALQNAGCSSADYIRYCLEQQRIQTTELHLLADEFSCDAAAKYCEAPEGVRPGMFVYADGFVSSKVIPKRQICAIVGYVEDNTACAVCLKEKILPWSSDCLTGMLAEKTADSREAVRQIILVAHQKNQMAEAAQWCCHYTQDGIKQGEAYLPSLEELSRIYVNKDEINYALETLLLIRLLGVYWSSAECDAYNAWCLSMYGGCKVPAVKNSLLEKCVRAVIRIRF